MPFNRARQGIIGNAADAPVMPGARPTYGARAAVYASDTTNGTHSVPGFASGLTVGKDLLIIEVAIKEFNVTPTAQAVLSAAANADNWAVFPGGINNSVGLGSPANTDDVVGAWFYKIADGASQAAVDIVGQNSASNTTFLAVMHRYNGVDGFDSPPIQAISAKIDSGGADSVSVPGPTIVPPNANCLGVASYSIANDRTGTKISGSTPDTWVEVSDVLTTLGADAALMTDNIVLPGSGVSGGNRTLNAATAFVGYGYALVPAEV